MRTTTCLNKGWLFSKTIVADAHLPSFDDSMWESVDIPHDWRIYEAFDKDVENGTSQGFLPHREAGWYRASFTMPARTGATSSWLSFGGVYRNCEVWLNGNSLGKWAYGYTSFQMQIHETYLNPSGVQHLAVFVDSRKAPCCRWYSGAGIYRSVYITTTHAVHIPEWGFSVECQGAAGESAMVTLDAHIDNQLDVPVDAVAKFAISSADGVELSSCSVPIHLEASVAEHAIAVMFVDDPILWSATNPSLYIACVDICVEGQSVDQMSTKFGIRSIHLDSHRGLLVNGEPTKLKGVNMHHDLGCLGTEVYEDALRRRLSVLKEMGCNAIRCSHNPPAEELLYLCDEMGFYVIDESFDKWRSGSYGSLFDEWWAKDVTSMVMRDRNHPSVIIWSVGNEVEAQGTPSMNDDLAMLVAHVKSLDKTRPVTFAMEPHNNPHTLLENIGIEGIVTRTLEMAEKVDIAACNYHEQWYEAYRDADPNILLLGTETFPYYRGRDGDFLIYDAINPWFDAVKHDWVVGGFVWAGVDYIGESIGWPSKGWTASLVDTCGHRRPLSWFFQSVWSDQPMVYISVYDETMKSGHENLRWSWPKQASHWTHPSYEGQLIRLCTYTNCQEVTLRVNGKYYGKRSLAEYPNQIIEWHVPYAPGTIEAVGYVMGESVCSHKLATAGEASHIMLEASRIKLRRGSDDLAYVDASIRDEVGVLVPWASMVMSFEAEGSGEIFAVDNGDLSSDEPYRATTRRTFNGRCMCVVKPRAEAGEVTIYARAEGLPPAKITLQSE